LLADHTIESSFFAFKSCLSFHFSRNS
jgi:hypothetical protein